MSQRAFRPRQQLTVAGRLRSVLTDARLYRQLLRFKGPDAQALLNLFQSVSMIMDELRICRPPLLTLAVQLLDNPTNAEFRRSLIVVAQRLSKKSGLYPDRYELKGIQQDESEPVTAGGFADIYRGTFEGHTAADVGEGLSYLHKNNIIHGDLKGGGSLRWQTPELFDMENDQAVKNSTFSDVYALGCVCYEVFTDNVPFHNVSRDATVMLQIQRGSHPSQPPESSLAWRKWGLTQAIWDLIQDCWKENPLSRPTTEEVLLRLSPRPREDVAGGSRDELSPKQFRRRMCEPLDEGTKSTSERILRELRNVRSGDNEGASLYQRSTSSNAMEPEPHKHIDEPQSKYSRVYQSDEASVEEEDTDLKHTAVKDRVQFTFAIDNLMIVAGKMPRCILRPIYNREKQRGIMRSLVTTWSYGLHWSTEGDFGS
ncbi:hypothetical protein H0H87_000323 [Tephrocybe sp. NHM501043]|nr:hypothetical protein H0H87_000323 [Tephrocybe sp. NHM501043]